VDDVTSSRLRVLDAGCGREIKGPLFPGAYVVGIDVDEAALARNHEVDEKIVGDIQSYPFADDFFDAITCFDVLEHLREPERALANLARALKPGGEIHVGIPNVSSPKGIATKLTPHRFHIWFYRHVVGDRTAGARGFGPYKTYLRWSLRPTALDRLARRAGLKLVSVEHSEGSFFAAFWTRHRVSWALVRAIWRVAGLGNPRWTDCTVVMRKDEEPATVSAVGR
jgi:SAM-dependent methyltransferase